MIRPRKLTMEPFLPPHSMTCASSFLLSFLLFDRGASPVVTPVVCAPTVSTRYVCVYVLFRKQLHTTLPYYWTVLSEAPNLLYPMDGMPLGHPPLFFPHDPALVRAYQIDAATL